MGSERGDVSGIILLQVRFIGLNTYLFFFFSFLSEFWLNKYKVLALPTKAGIYFPNLLVFCQVSSPKISVYTWPVKTCYSLAPKISDNSFCAGFAQYSKMLRTFTLSFSWLPRTTAVRNITSERKSPSGRAWAAQREGNSHSEILRDREQREIRSPREKDRFWCWFHWIIIQ